MRKELIIFEVVALIANIYIANTENKKKIYWTTFLFNFINMVLYVCINDTSTIGVYIITTVRSFVYIYREKLKSPLIPAIFIIANVVVGLLFIESNWQLLPILSMNIVCVYMWFSESTQTLRIFNAICNFIWFVYNIKTGFFIVALSRMIVVFSNIESFFRHWRKSKNFVEEYSN